MKKIMLTILVIVVSASLIIPVMGSSLSENPQRVVGEIEESLSINKGIDLSISQLGNNSFVQELEKIDGKNGTAFAGQLSGERVGIEIGGISDRLRVESDDVSVTYNESVKANVKGNLIDFSEPLSIEDVYNLSEEQEEIVSPGEDMEDENIVKDEPVKTELIDK